MCKEDVKLGRRKEVVSSGSLTAQATRRSFVGANANRAALIVCGPKALTSETVPDQTYAELKAGPDATSPTVAILTSNERNFVLTVEEYGQLVLGPWTMVFATAYDGSSARFDFVDLAWTGEL